MSGSREAMVLGTYLIGRAPGQQEIETYARARELTQCELTTRFETRLWSWMMKRPRMIGTFDAGLALLAPDSPLRKRIFVMLAVLEASPDHVDHFLPGSFSRLRLIPLSLRMLLAGVRSVVGTVLVKSLQVIWR